MKFCALREIALLFLSPNFCSSSAALVPGIAAALTDRRVRNLKLTGRASQQRGLAGPCDPGVLAWGLGGAGPLCEARGGPFGSASQAPLSAS
jgi:hypothetical protein